VSAPNPHHQTRNRRILLVDELPSIHEDFRRILSGADPARRPSFDLDSAYLGGEALSMVRSSMEGATPYALAFVDVRLPQGRDGVEIIEEIWNVDPQVQVVICTDHPDDSWDAILGRLGGQDRLLVLKKPLDDVEVTQLATALTTRWELTRHAELEVSRLEVAILEQSQALELANRELQELGEEVTKLATHDSLTGLPNRLLFADRALQVLAVARRDGSRPAVLRVDLDHFKEVNDTLGHHHGDLLLIQVAQRLSRVLRPSDTVARFGGDEFVLLLSDGGSEAGAEVARRIADVLEAPFRLGDSTVGVEASVGIAASGSDQHPSMEELLRQAGIAMYRAKTDRSGHAHYAACTDDGTQNRLMLIGELRQALERGELVVYYQPKVAVDTGELLGVEALVRWQHPTRGLLLPGEFIALAEGSTLIQRLTRVVLDSALLSCRTSLDEGLTLPVAVNVSARSLCDPQFPAMVSDRLAHARVSASLLTIELTEGTVLAYPGMARGILQKLRDTGVHISVDDYGTGYSSMAYLKHLPVTELKIDRGFIKDLVDDPHDVVMVQSATELGHNLGLSVVAEGVEDEMTLVTLKSIGVDIAQGFHLGHPMPEALLRVWIQDRTSATVPDVASPPT